MTTTQRTRPWYCRDTAVDEHRAAIESGKETSTPKMKSTLVAARSLLVNAGIIGLGAYGLSLGGDPTFLTALIIAILGAYNGMEFQDLAEFWAAYREAQKHVDDGEQP